MSYHFFFFRKGENVLCIFFPVESDFNNPLFAQSRAVQSGMIFLFGSLFKTWPTKQRFRIDSPILSHRIYCYGQQKTHMSLLCILKACSSWSWMKCLSPISSLLWECLQILVSLAKLRVWVCSGQTCLRSFITKHVFHPRPPRVSRRVNAPLFCYCYS